MLRCSVVRSMLVLALLVVGSGSPLFAQQDASRQSASFPFDATTVSGLWVEGRVGYEVTSDSATTRDASAIALALRGAYPVLPELEVGVDVGFVARNFDDGRLGDASGVTDTLLWGKYQFPSPGAWAWNAGAFLSLPTGDEDEFLGSGNLDPGAFVAGGIKIQGDAFVQGYAGLRSNSEFDRPRRRSIDGKTSFLAGFGGSVPLPSSAELFAMLNLETERYESGDATVQVQGGGRWPVARNWRFQVTGGVGLTDAAPDFSIGIGLVFNE